MAAFSRHAEALAWARHRAVGAWGPLALESRPFAFNQTDYYEPTMGRGLRKVFLAFAELADPADLAQWKLLTNTWEAEYAATGRHPEARPLNLDPGYLTLAKLVLASTKDFAHRIYLGRGVFAEITLSYHHHAWQDHQWTLADYRQQAYHEFFSQCREYLHRRLREAAVA
ncbi:MAG: DUF4416 family protein [Thermoguttaceae bacterium]